MKANETKIETFLSSNKTQFVIPVYQRNYDWNKIQCEQLFNDILEVGAHPDIHAHFIGSIVYVHDDVYTSSRLKELVIIDGQQRLTTLTLIYLALYHFAHHIEQPDLAHEISETYLINKYAPHHEKLKLKPTENHLKALQFLLHNDIHAEFHGFSRFIENFHYFQSRITLDNYATVLSGLAKLMFVEVSLERGKDNPQRIFESLNSTGLELSQADLIRNYILMGLNREDQEHIYQQYWANIEQLAKDETSNTSLVSDFIRDYLTLRNKKIPVKNKVYLEFKANYPTTSLHALEEHLKSFKTFAKYYNKLINPAQESDAAIRKQLHYIKKLEINVAYPFLMKVYDDYTTHIISQNEMVQILELVQSFVWRRFILGLPTNALNKIFMNLYDKVDTRHYLFSIQKTLLSKTGSQRFPRDAEIKDALKIKDLYNIQSKNRTYLFERLENWQNTETVAIDNNPHITTEHIFPQNPDSTWQQALPAEEYRFIQETYLNTLGNLTLSGNNGKLSNKPFLEKRDLAHYGYRDSRLWLNKYLASLNQWGQAEIEQRCALMTQRFLQVWQQPELPNLHPTHHSEVNIFDAEDPTHKKLEYAVFLNQNLPLHHVSKLYSEVFKRLLEQYTEEFFSTGLADKINLTPKGAEHHLRQAIPLNDYYFIEGNIDNVHKFDRIKTALTAFGLEDELLIKYAETEETP